VFLCSRAHGSWPCIHTSQWTTEVAQMKVDSDTRQRASVAVSFILESYKVLMGALLVAFVPHDCGAQCGAVDALVDDHGSVHRLAVTWNVVALLAALCLYAVEIKREHFCIKYLDINPSLPNNHLDEAIEKHPVIKSRMRSLNVLYLRASTMSLIVVSANALFSGLYLFPANRGVSTLTAFVSYLLLLYTKLIGAYQIGSYSVHKERAYSAFMKTKKTYNCIDTDYANQHESSPLTVPSDTNSIEVVIGN